MKEFKLWKENYYYEDQKLFENDAIALEEDKITCLIGCNGLGKTTIVRQIAK